MLVEVPVEFRGGGPVTLTIEIDTDGILSAANAPDAANYGDEGADTLGHIYERVPGLELRNLDAMGLAGARAGSAGGTPTLLCGKLRSVKIRFRHQTSFLHLTSCVRPPIRAL